MMMRLFLRVVNVPRREIGSSTLEKLGSFANQVQQSLNAAAQHPELESTLTGRGLTAVRHFTQWLENTRKRSQGDDSIRVIKQLFTDIEYEEWLAETSNTPKQADKRMANVWYLIDSLQKLLDADKGTADEMTLEDGIARLVLRDMLEQQDEEEELDKVHLLTLHASKGLEFPHVFIMGLEEEILPHRTSIEEGNIEEERRLMYVGITRARQTLTLTYAAQRKQYGEKIETIPSRFLDEMPDEDLEWQTLTQKNPEQNKIKGSQTMAALLADLKGS
jgi:ATP-dependent DNA helicase Rep